MDLQTEGVTRADKFFLEYHFYKGGLRTEAFSLTSSRPEWAPPADWVGFRDEFSLTPEASVLEVVKFAGEIGPIVWIGVYAAAPDEVYGDRKNHAGIGVWLLGSYPKQPSLLVEALQRLLDVARKDDGKRFAGKATSFLNAYLGAYIADYEVFPQPLGGLVGAANQVTPTIERRMDADGKSLDEQINEFVYRLFFTLPEVEADKSRALALLPSKLEAHDAGLLASPLGQLLSDLLDQLPIALSAQSRSIASLQAENASKDATISQLEFHSEQLNSELALVRGRAEQAESQLNTLQASLDADDERKRYSYLQSELSRVGSNISQINNNINSMRHELINIIERNMKPAQENAFKGSQIRSQNYDRDLNYKIKKSDLLDESAISIILIASICFIILIIIGYVVWSSLSH